MGYSWLKESLCYGNYCITSLRECDILLIKNWRNEQIKILRQNKLLSDLEQLAYYHQTVIPSMNEDKPKMILVSYLLGGDCIGYGGLTNIDWVSHRAEISFLLNTERISNPSVYQQDFTVFLSLVKKLAFEVLGFNRLFTETYDIRPLHIETLISNGFQLEGRMKQHVFIDGKFYDSLIHGYIREYYHAKR